MTVYDSRWLLMTIDDHWWTLMTVDVHWWPLMTIDDHWWPLMTFDMAMRIMGWPYDSLTVSCYQWWLPIAWKANMWDQLELLEDRLNGLRIASSRPTLLCTCSFAAFLLIFSSREIPWKTSLVTLSTVFSLPLSILGFQVYIGAV